MPPMHYGTPPCGDKMGKFEIKWKCPITYWITVRKCCLLVLRWGNLCPEAPFYLSIWLKRVTTIDKAQSIWSHDSSVDEAMAYCPNKSYGSNQASLNKFVEKCAIVRMQEAGNMYDCAEKYLKRRNRMDHRHFLRYMKIGLHSLNSASTKIIA